MSEINFITSYTELDKAFGEKLEGLIINNDVIEPIFTSPDIDIELASIPAIVFYRTSESPDNTRWSVDKIRDNWQFDGSNNPVSVDLRENPEPWNFIYVVRLYYRYQEDGGEMNFFMHKRFPRNSFLEIKGVKYDCTMINTPQKLFGAEDVGTNKYGEREFVDQFTFRVEANLDIYDRDTLKVIREVIFRKENI